MSDGSEIFQTYEKEYATLHESITLKLSTSIPSAKGEAKKLLINQTQRELEEADEIISQMEMEIVSLPGPMKAKLQPRVKSFKDEIRKAKKDLSKGGSERDQLLGTGSSHAIDFEANSMDQRSRLLNGTERLQDGSRRLEEARRIALETEAMGINTLSDLSAQREQIGRTRDRLQNADSWITKSSGVLKGMQRQMMQNKLLTFGIIAALIALIIIVIYFKWFN